MYYLYSTFPHNQSLPVCSKRSPLKKVSLGAKTSLEVDSPISLHPHLWAGQQIRPCRPWVRTNIDLKCSKSWSASNFVVCRHTSAATLHLLECFKTPPKSCHRSEEEKIIVGKGDRTTLKQYMKLQGSVLICSFGYQPQWPKGKGALVWSQQGGEVRIILGSYVAG